MSGPSDLPGSTGCPASPWCSPAAPTCPTNPASFRTKASLARFSTTRSGCRAKAFRRLPSSTGGAYMPALCDETVIVRNQGAMFLGGPPLVYAATREEVGIEALGGGEMHSRVSGVTDYLAENDSHAIAITRDIVAHLGDIPPQRWQVATPRPPRCDPS